MLEPESFQIIAEISIAFAGFTGLIVAFRKNRGPLTEVEKYRLRILLTLAFGAMFLSFLPQLLQLFEFDPAATWRWSSVSLALYSLVFLAWWIAASRKIMQSVPEIFNWYAFSRMAFGHAVVLTLQVAVVASVVEGKAPAVYLLGLIWLLAHASQQFARMLFIQPKKTRQQSPG